jgi:glutamyl/glutaminyl-tRNA synthetase
MQPLQNSLIRSRIAPTPSGYLHIGNAYSFLLTSQLVQQHGGTLLLRIDDMDSDRVRQEYIQDVFDTVNFLGISYQQGPTNANDFQENYSQKFRLPLYQDLLDKLCKTELVYACNCSRKTLQLNNNTCQCWQKKLALDASNVAWRIHVPVGTIIRFTDVNLGAVKMDLSSVMPDFIIRKKDGMPAYQISSLADDLYYCINYIVRGEDLVCSTAAQLYLASLINAESFINTTFHHHALLKNMEGEKLSKSAGATSIKHLRERGATLQDLLKQLG